MGNKCKRFLTMLLMAVLLISAMSMNVLAAETDTAELECYTYGDVNGDDVIDQKDAIHLLYHTVMAESYPLNGRGGDMDGDGDIDKDDAIRLLFHTFPSLAEAYPLAKEGKIHAYYEPVWTWNVTDGETVCMAATVSVKCACGQELTGTADVYPNAKAATCTEDGYEKYSVTITVGGVNYDGAYEVVLPATGHNVTATCAGEASCQNDGCDYKVAAVAHSWVEVSKTEATCGAAGKIGYECSVCEATKTEVIPATGEHSYGEETAVAVEGKSCTYVKVKTCSVCGDEVRSSEYEEHSYTDKVTVTKQPTCTEKGEKVYTCDKCTSTKTEEITVNSEAHNWVGQGNGAYACSCGATKTVVSVDNNTDVSTENLTGTELALAEDTALTLDGNTVENLPADQIRVSVENVAGEVELTDEQKEAIGDNPIYDFNMTYVDENGETQPVSGFSGDITVTVPYVLGENEDPESIAVWYIDGDGETVTINATYANGYITFTTNHFSYYTVTRLSVKERCALYGHKYGTMDLTKAATCTDGGYEYQVCQRCAHVNVVSTTEALGHSYKDTDAALAATCEAAGKFSQVCEHCENLVEYEIPALGHDYEATVTDATCEKAGKTVYDCKNCDHSYEDIIPQLEHEYEDFDGGVKDPTCDEKGHRKHRCKLCKHEKTVEEYPALGHHYPETDEEAEDKQPEWNWNWEEDVLIDVTVEIGCTHENCEHTKQLNAVITEEDDTDCEGGTITYHAKAAHNGHSFEDHSDPKEVEGEGHQHGDKWHTDALKHYHKCEVCQEVHDSATHNWDEGTVTAEATCVAKGETVYKCTVCGYEKKQVTDATNKHDLVDGVCSVCGYQASTCAHIVNKHVTLDMSEYGACGGWVTVSTCECGENAYAWDWSLECEFVGTSEERTTEDGTTYIVYIHTCEVCGLVIESGWCEYITTDPCQEAYFTISKFTIGDEVILDGGRSGVFESHPTHWTDEYETISLSDYGLCSEVLTKRVCPCGERIYYGTNSRCSWSYVSGQTYVDGAEYVCTNCGARKINKSTEEIDEANCAYLWSYSVTYYVDDEVVYTYTNNEQHEWHSYVLSNIKVQGDNCEEDGVTYDRTCSVCGETRTDYDYWHMPVDTKVMDLSAYDICYDMAYQSTCACDLAVRDYSFDSGMEGNYCDWVALYENGAGGKSADYCLNCGAVRTYSCTESEPDENCLVKYTWKYELADMNGNHIMTYYRDEFSSEHEYDVTHELKGETCEDGVTSTYTCINCGHNYSYIRYWCNTSVVETVDLSSLGGCIQYVERYSCPCGQYAGLWYTYGSSNCSWNWVDEGEDYVIHKCSECGILREERRVKTVIDDCNSRMQYTYTFSKDGKSKSVTYARNTTNHSTVYELTLKDGATDCTGGFTVARVCQKCDYRENYSGTWYDHEAYRVAAERLDDGTVCGEFYMDTVSCACGQESWTNTRWANGSCSFEWYYDEEMDREIQKCYGCDTVREYVTTETPVEGTCDVECTQHVVYLRDGEEIFSYDDSWTSTRHGWKYEFNLYGESCDDGYDYTATCANCGATDSGTGLYGHRAYWTWAKVVEHEDICSTMYMQTAQCACGECDYGWGWNYDCSFSWQYDEALDRYCSKCNECGLVRVEEGGYTGTDDPCVWDRNITYTCYLNGEEIGTYTRSYRETRHSYSYDFTLYGTTCDDGYTFTRTCKKCGDYEDRTDTTWYGCEWWMMDQEMLYSGENACGAVIYYSDGCACGNLSSNWRNYNCSFSGQYDETLGRYVNKCVDCGLVWMTDVTYGEPDENCNVTTSCVYTFMLNGEVVATKSMEFTEKQHSWTREFNLLGEDCDDGYTVTSVCSNCGQRYESSEVHYGHDSWRTGEIVVHDGEGTCGQMVIYPWSCACGRERGIDWSHNCNFSGRWLDSDTVYYECNFCDFNYTRTDSEGPTGENCDYIRTYDYTFKLGDEVINTYSYSTTQKDHNWTREFTLLGETCADGYMVKSTCTRCGEATEYEGTYHGCENWSMGDVQVIYENENLCGPIYVESYRCACGLRSGYNVYPTCDYYEYWDEELGWIYGCDDCGLKFYSLGEYLGEGENCVRLYRTRYTFYIGEETFEYSYNYQNLEHTWVYTYEIVDGADTCDAGYYRTQVCAKCGYVSGRDGIYYGHDTNRVEYYDLSDYGLCGGSIRVYSCACGENSYVNWYNGCNYHYTGNVDETTGASERYCSTCGNYTYYLRESEYVRKNCRTEGNFYFEVRNEETPLVIDRDYYQTQHTYVATEMTLTGTSGTCNDGYKVKRECQYCDAYTESWGSGHDEYTVKFIDLTDYTNCEGANYLIQSSCACGQEQGFEYNVCDEFCWDTRWTEIDENGTEHYYEQGSCATCGLEMLWHEYTKLDEGSCEGTRYRYLTVTLGDTLNETLVYTYRGTWHNWTYEFDLLGEFCKDGYTRDQVCTRCGTREESDYVYYGCSTYDMGDEQVIHDGEGICGPITVESYTCACGSHAGVNIRRECSMSGYWDSTLQGYVYECYYCDMKYTDSSEFLSKDENCVEQYQHTYTFYIGEETVPYTYVYKTMSHSYVYTYEMVDGATSCEDGYYRIRVCADCGYEDGRSGIYYGHDTNCVERYDLADYGLCGGYVRYYSCACGQESYVNSSQHCGYSYTGNVDENTKAEERYCGTCGNYTYYLNVSELDRQNCRYEGNFYFEVRNEETPLVIEKDYYQTSHTYVTTEMTLTGEYGSADSCEGGYWAKVECQYCGDSYETSGNSHDRRTVKFIDLEEVGGCGGYLEQRECACGLYQDFNYSHPISWNGEWTEEDENGTVHTYDTGSCSKCGLTVTEHRYTQLEEGSCDGTYYCYYTFTLGDTLNETLVYSYPTTEHDWSAETYTLAEGSTSCTDGITVTQVCRREGCGETNSWNRYPGGHYYQNVTDSIDLADYGSICGETLDYYQCPCGEAYRWSFDNENHCDLDQKDTDFDWLTEVIERKELGEKLVDTSQYTTEGYVSSWSYAYTFTCAVTNPEACGLKVRMAEYWVKNGCEVTEYQTWQLGYDADAGTWQDEITVATGDKHAYHDYEYSDADEYDENGNYTLDVNLYSCPDCGSYYKRQWVYEDGENVKYERELVNTLDNGERKRTYEVSEYGEERAYEYNGYTYSSRYQTLSRCEYTYADDSEYWYQYAYTYNFEDTCLRTYVYTDSNGAYDTGTETCHHDYGSSEDLEERTCTQYGSYRYWWTCYVCGTITSDYTYQTDPSAHYWNWDSTKETYVCYYCGLENINGASGVVVMEDLTEDEKWGSETDYVIGYWNRENVKFTVELSVIFVDRDEDHEDGNQFVLTGVEIADRTKDVDGFVGKSFNKEAAYAAAEAKMTEQGYTGSYAIRINFVPANDDTDLDYAITFDTVLVDPGTLAGRLEQAATLDNGEYLPYSITVEGTVTAINSAYNATYGNLCFTMSVEGESIYCYRASGEGMDTLLVGDTVQVTGALMAYNGTPQFDSKATYTITGKATPTMTDPGTMAGRLEQAATLANGEYLPYSIDVTGTVTAINTAYSETYGNISITISVDGESIYCYRVTGDGIDTLAVGDTVQITGFLTAYNSNPQFDKTATVTVLSTGDVAVEEATTEPAVEESTEAAVEESTEAAVEEATEPAVEEPTEAATEADYSDLEESADEILDSEF